MLSLTRSVSSPPLPSSTIVVTEEAANDLPRTLIRPLLSVTSIVLAFSLPITVSTPRSSTGFNAVSATAGTSRPSSPSRAGRTAGRADVRGRLGVFLLVWPAIRRYSFFRSIAFRPLVCTRPLRWASVRPRWCPHQGKRSTRRDRDRENQRVEPSSRHDGPAALAEQPGEDLQGPRHLLGTDAQRRAEAYRALAAAQQQQA